jgi:hypothetical protein
MILNNAFGFQFTESVYFYKNYKTVLLKHSYGLSSLSANLKANKPNGITDAQID